MSKKDTNEILDENQQSLEETSNDSVSELPTEAIENFKYFEKGPKRPKQLKESSDEHIYYHYELFTGWTDEEIEEANRKEREESEKALEQIKADGFIEFPIWFENVDGETVERSAWIPPNFEPSCSEGFREKYGMNYNIYIPSYERYDKALTMKMLDRLGVKNYYIAVDPTQYEKYKAVFGPDKIIIRDIYFKDTDMLDMATSIKSPNTMHGTAGIYNFLLSFSRSIGEEKYWTMDDDFLGMAMKAHKGSEIWNPSVKPYNKEDFYRCSNIKSEYGFSQAEFLCSMEDLSNKMRNPGFVGLEKFGIVFTLPVVWKLGTRVYSFYLSDNKTQINHFGGNNNDVVTSLELSKRGLVNMLFEGISYNSEPTQGGGGLTTSYRRFGTLQKGKILVRAVPNFSKISYNYSRIHHFVDYNGYNRQRIVGAVKPEEEK